TWRGACSKAGQYAAHEWRIIGNIGGGKVEHLPVLQIVHDFEFVCIRDDEVILLGAKAEVQVVHRCRRRIQIARFDHTRNGPTTQSHERVIFHTVSARHRGDYRRLYMQRCATREHLTQNKEMDTEIEQTPTTSQPSVKHPGAASLQVATDRAGDETEG